MANIVLYQTGNKSRDPKSGTYYDPWESHIWLCIEQIRKWNQKIDIYMITDDCEVSNEDNFIKFNIKREYTYELATKYDVENIPYFNSSNNPSERACGLRPFYIESVMSKYKLKDTYSFDNDVLIYCDLEDLSNKINPLYKRVAVTATAKDLMVLGMCYIKDYKSFSDITKLLWDIMVSDIGQNLLDMGLWNLIHQQKGEDYVDVIPSWGDGMFSDNNQIIGGIFDPSSIGQFLLGCDNGNPPGTLFTHHYIHNRLKENIYEFHTHYDDSKKYLTVFNKQNSTHHKILSIHVHNKKLKLLM